MLVAAAHTYMRSIVGLAICLLLLLHLKQDAHSKHMHRQTPADLNKTSSAASIPKHQTASDSCAGSHQKVSCCSTRTNCMLAAHSHSPAGCATKCLLMGNKQVGCPHQRCCVIYVSQTNKAWQLQQQPRSIFKGNKHAHPTTKMPMPLTNSAAHPWTGVFKNQPQHLYMEVVPTVSNKTAATAGPAVIPTAGAARMRGMKTGMTTNNGDHNAMQSH